jgi:hypothetical protein
VGGEIRSEIDPNALATHYFVNARKDRVARYYDFSIFGVALEQNINWLSYRLIRVLVVQ